MIDPGCEFAADRVDQPGGVGEDQEPVVGVPRGQLGQAQGPRVTAAGVAVAGISVEVVADQVHVARGQAVHQRVEEPGPLVAVAGSVHEDQVLGRD